VLFCSRHAAQPTAGVFGLPPSLPQRCFDPLWRLVARCTCFHTFACFTPAALLGPPVAPGGPPGELHSFVSIQIRFDFHPRSASPTPCGAWWRAWKASFSAPWAATPTSRPLAPRALRRTGERGRTKTLSSWCGGSRRHVMHNSSMVGVSWSQTGSAAACFSVAQHGMRACHQTPPLPSGGLFGQSTQLSSWDCLQGQHCRLWAASGCPKPQVLLCTCSTAALDSAGPYFAGTTSTRLCCRWRAPSAGACTPTPTRSTCCRGARSCLFD